jgi:hypothetical protein
MRVLTIKDKLLETDYKDKLPRVEIVTDRLSEVSIARRTIHEENHLSQKAKKQ